MIKDNFSGRITLFEIDCFFAFSNGYSLEIIPNSKDVDLFRKRCDERERNFNSLGWIHGVDNSGCDVAFLISEQQISMCYHNDVLTLITDIILQTWNSKGLNGEYPDNYTNLEGFTAIDFIGEPVDIIFSPTIAIKKEHISNTYIELLSTEEYAKSFSTELDGIKCNLIFTVGVYRYGYNSTNLGKLHSIVRLEFDERQELSMIETCWQAVCTLLSFCVRQYNVTNLQVGLWDMVKPIGPVGLTSTIRCKINHDSVEGVKYEYPAYYRFQIDYFGEKLGNLFKLLNCKKTMPILHFLPQTNLDHSVNRSKIRELCTALEVEFDYFKTKIDNSAVTDLVKDLKSVVGKFRKENPDALDPVAYSYIYGTFKHISMPAAEKLWQIYKKYAEIIDTEMVRLSFFPYNCTEQQTKNDIGWLIKLRNNITHSTGSTESCIPNKIYSRLQIALYCSVLERSGYSIKEISSIIKNFFAGFMISNN